MLSEVSDNELSLISTSDNDFSHSAKLFAGALKKAENVPVDVTDTIEMNLPDFADCERMKK
jgi:hypothetical protein